MQISLEGKKAVVTGASSGIGRAIAFAFGREGAEVALLARREKNLQEVKKQIEKNGGQAHIFPVDLREPRQIAEVFQQIRRKMGAPEILVNNAGMGFHGSVAEATLEEYQETFDLNVRAYFLCVKEVLPAMTAARSGSIVNIGSIVGKMGLARSALYSASKFAVTGFSEALLEEVREDNIRVSLICPGLVNTEFFGRRKKPPRGEVADYIQPEDIAEVAVLCAGDTRTATLKEIIVCPRRPIR